MKINWERIGYFASICWCSLFIGTIIYGIFIDKPSPPRYEIVSSTKSNYELCFVSDREHISFVSNGEMKNFRVCDIKFISNSSQNYYILETWKEIGNPIRCEWNKITIYYSDKEALTGGTVKKHIHRSQYVNENYFKF